MNNTPMDIASITQRMELLLLSQDKDSVLLGLELAMNPAIAASEITLVVALSLFHRSEAVRESAERVLGRLGGANLRNFIRENWEPTHLKGKPEVFYEAVRAIGKHNELDADRFLKLAVQLRRKAPERIAHHFPQAFYEWAKLRIGQSDTLSLSGYDFPYLPGTIGEFTQLRSLHLENSGLRRLPESLTRLQQLLQLDINDNQLTELPDFLTELPALEQINWEGNPILQFPEVLARMPRIRSVNIDMRNVQDLSGLGKCKQVEWVRLKYAKEDSVPDPVLELWRLNGLTIRKAGLNKLPEGLAKLKRLEDLDLEDNHFDSMPEVLPRLRRLKFLTLGEVMTPGNTVSLAGLENLNRLTMSPRFSEWPAGWCQLPRLRTLRLADGRLSQLPPAFSQLVSLQSLDLANNSFTRFPEILYHVDLMDLNLHGNRLSEVPEGIAQLTSLTVLDLSHNPLTVLPESIYTMKRLVRLELQNTQLTLEQVRRLEEELPNTRIRTH